MTEPLKWTLPDNCFELTVASPHFNTCTHRMDNVLLVKDAEQLAVFWDVRRNCFHYSLRYQDWYSCGTVNEHQFEAFIDDPMAEMAYVQDKLRFLQSLHR